LGVDLSHDAIDVRLPHTFDRQIVPSIYGPLRFEAIVEVPVPREKISFGHVIYRIKQILEIFM
jgi:hypothetical protein